MCLLDDLQNAILTALVPNSEVQVETTSQDVDTYIKYVRSNLPSSFLQLVARVIHPEYRKYCPAVDRCFWLLTSVAGVLIEKTDSSINQINQALIERHVYAERSQDQNIQSEADQCTFCILGWLTLLYRPKYPHREITGFSIDTQASPSFSGDSQPLSQSSRPFLEIVGVFDAIEIFSKRQIGRDEKEVLSANPSATYLQPSHLGAAILTSIGRLSICWVDSLGSHLELDITNRKLFLFRLPSFVRLQATAGSLLPALFASLESHGRGGTMYSTEHLANEILDSYSILFDCERKSRTIYSAMREKSAFSNGIGDPLLDELCGYHRPRWSISDLAPPRAAMDASLCFPILSTRLLKLQTYMDGQGARGLRALHRDRRDSYQWWTFWAVIWLGGLNLVFAFTQTITGIIQVVYAMKAARCSAL